MEPQAQPPLPQHQASLPPQPQSFVTGSSQQRRKSPLKKILLTLLVLILLAGVGYLGYCYYHTNNDLKAARANLATSNARVATLEEDQKITIYNANAYDTLKQHTGCADSDPVVFNQTTLTAKKADGSNKLIALGQYFCISGDSVQSGPLRFIAAQSYDEGKTWEMAYGASTVNPYELPNFIYETNPKLINQKYNNPSHH